MQTRMRKLEEEGYDGTLLAAAGLKRLGMEHVIGQYFSVNEIIPAAGQGILAVQGRRGEDYSWLACVDDPESRAAAAAERAFICTVGGGCTSPSAAHAQVSGNEVKLTGLYYNEDSGEYFVDSVISEIGRVQGAAENLARKLTENCM